MNKPDDKVDAEQASMMWQKLCAVSQRLLLARAVENKISTFQMGHPDENKQKLLKSLSDEMVMLNFVKSQLEEAITRYFSQEVTLADYDTPPKGVNFSLPNNELATVPITNLTTPVAPAINPSTIEITTVEPPEITLPEASSSSSSKKPEEANPV
jgi:hypothetical protein